MAGAQGPGPRDPGQAPPPRAGRGPRLVFILYVLCLYLCLFCSCFAFWLALLLYFLAAVGACLHFGLHCFCIYFVYWLALFFGRRIVLTIDRDGLHAKVFVVMFVDGILRNLSTTRLQGQHSQAREGRLKGAKLADRRNHPQIPR